MPSNRRVGAAPIGIFLAVIQVVVRFDGFGNARSLTLIRKLKKTLAR